MKMNRREFIQASLAAPAVTMIPTSSAATTAKYPLIGQKLFGIIITKEQWEMNTSNKFFPHSRVHLVLPFNNGHDTRPRVEVFMKKSKNMYHAPDITQLPIGVSYGADTIVDMETFSLVKCRNSHYRGELKIPIGADKRLVMENRKKWSKA